MNYKNAYEEMKKLYELLQQKNKQLKQKNKQLKDNWNKLKEYVGAEWYCYDNDSVEFEVAKDILNNIRDLEQGSDNE